MNGRRLYGRSKNKCADAVKPDYFPGNSSSIDDDSVNLVFPIIIIIIIIIIVFQFLHLVFEFVLR
jgi:hypothetical protein